jgi:hypothetical protein
MTAEKWDRQRNTLSRVERRTRETAADDRGGVLQKMGEEIA